MCPTLNDSTTALAQGCIEKTSSVSISPFQGFRRNATSAGRVLPSLHHSVAVQRDSTRLPFSHRFPTTTGFASRPSVRVAVTCCLYISVFVKPKNYCFRIDNIDRLYFVMFCGDVRCDRLCGCQQSKKSFAERQNPTYQVCRIQA